MKLNLLAMKEVVYFSEKKVEFKHFEYFFGKKLEKYQFTVRSLCLNYFDYQYTCEPVCSNDVTLMY